MPTVNELLAEAKEALGITDRDARAARLFVVAGKLHATGDEVATVEARALLAKAAHDGSALAAFDLAMLLCGGRGGDVETGEGLTWLRRAATELPAAAVVLGGMLLFVADSAGEGVEWLRRAATAGEAPAFWLLGAAHLRGLGVAVDAHKARVLCAAAAEAGVIEAQLELAQMYHGGIGGARDEAAAARWERAAAEGGSAAACLRVAERAASRGGGLPLAIPWLERAADAGSSEAAARLANIYLMGHEVPYDAAAAERWMARAKELGWRWDPE